MKSRLHLQQICWKHEKGRKRLTANPLVQCQALRGSKSFHPCTAPQPLDWEEESSRRARGLLYRCTQEMHTCAYVGGGGHYREGTEQRKAERERFRAKTIRLCFYSLTKTSLKRRGGWSSQREPLAIQRNRQKIRAGEGIHLSWPPNKSAPLPTEHSERGQRAGLVSCFPSRALKFSSPLMHHYNNHWTGQCQRLVYNTETFLNISFFTKTVYWIINNCTYLQWQHSLLHTLVCVLRRVHILQLFSQFLGREILTVWCYKQAGQ